MKDIAFETMVVLEPRIGRYRYVRSAADAAKVLLREWPHELAGEKHEKALKAVLEVLKGEKPPAHGRLALVSAAREAKILPVEREYPLAAE